MARSEHSRLEGPGGFRWPGIALLQAVFPPRCLACGRLVGPRPPAAGTRPGDALAVLAEDMCRECGRSLPALSSPLCTVCGLPFENGSGGDHHCGRCLRRPPSYRRARAAGVHAGALRKAVHNLKYRRRLRLARPLGRLLMAARQRYFGRLAHDLLVPVPLHPVRLRRRGFNQARMLVGGWSRSGPRIPLPARILERTRPTATQTGLDRRLRRRNIRGAFRVRRPDAVAGRRLLLIDDVLTTGATADECARVLVAAGARRVDVLTVTRGL